MRFVNPPKAIDGSIYLFKKWKGSPAVIESKDKKTFVLDNINFNLKTNRFVTKISQDSIFVINMDKIDNINILGKVFKKIDSEISESVKNALDAPEPPSDELTKYIWAEE